MSAVDDLKTTLADLRMGVAQTNESNGIELVDVEVGLDGRCKLHLPLGGGKALDGTLVPGAKELAQKAKGLTHEVDVDVGDLLDEADEAMDDRRTIRGLHADESVQHMERTAGQRVVATDGGTAHVRERLRQFIVIGHHGDEG